MFKAAIGGFLVIALQLCSGAKYFIASPNLLRVGVEETVSISVFDVNGEVDIQLSLQDFPLRRRTFSVVSQKVRKERPALMKVKVTAKDLNDQKSSDKQYVYLKASSNTPGFQFNNEIKILVSYRNAMVFIQTDKPIYNPGQVVYLRVIPLSVNLKSSADNVTIEVSNPQGIRVDRWRNLNTKDGFFSRRLDLSKNALTGLWTITALYGHSKVQNASIQFEVKEYVLPTFSIKIKGPSYILDSHASIALKIASKYTYGENVIGSLQVILGVLDAGGNAERFSTSFHTLANGEADVNVPTDLVKRHPKIAWFPEGKRLFIEAKVIEKATGHEETAYHNSIFFTNSPLTVSFKRSPNFFKPGVPFEVMVDVRHKNGEPAGNIPIEIEAQTDQGVAVSESASNGNVNSDRSNELGHGRFVIDVPRTFTIVHLDIRVRAKISDMGNEIVSEGRFMPKMYRSTAHNYLFVRLVKKGKVGQSVDAEAFVVSSSAPSSLTYLVVANGHIVTQGSIDHQIGVLTTITIRITADMSPQARFVAFYRVNNELVADSAVIEVEEQLPNQVSFLGDARPQKYPGESYQIEIQSSPHSNVGLLAVDQSVYLLRNDKHLTSKEVFKRIKSHDLGCGAGAGKDNKDVLHRAGLAVMSTISNLKTDTRTEQSCAAEARRKRRSVDVDPRCCQLGEDAHPASCYARATNFSTSPAYTNFSNSDNCVIEFYKCCFIKYEQSSRARSVNVNIPNGLLNGVDFEMGEEFVKLTLEETQVRTYFPEKWLYEDQKAGKNGRVTFRVTVPDTITTWVLQAIAVSNTTGFGLTPSFNLRAFKPFFISIKLPYSAQRFEQVSVIATVFNYKETSEMVTIYMFSRGKDYCTYSTLTSGTAMYKIRVPGKGASSVSFPIVPTELGDIPIQLRIISKNGDADGEQRVLKVVPEGKEKEESHSVVLDPLNVLRDPSIAKAVGAPTGPSKIITSNKGKGEQKNRLSLRVPDFSVPGSEYAVLTVLGNLIGPAVSNMIDGKGLNNLIKLPTGCGEQTMLKLAPNVFILNYLRSTKQVTDQIERTAFGFIRSGYQNELNYRRSDNSFSAFGNSRPGSTWLTAFVVKTFCAIQKLDGIDVDVNVISTAINWLTTKQRGDGAIIESNPVIHQEMDGDINNDITMTAYVVTAFLECKGFIQISQQTVRNAVAFLESSQANIGRIYVRAVVAYALALADSPQKLQANQDLLNVAIYDAGKNTRHWDDAQGGNAIDVETTSYALLTQLALKRRGYAGPIVVWLTEQRRGGGGFVSTQDTCVALQALAGYSEASGGDQLNMRIEITTDRNYKKTLMINQRNALVQQRLDLTHQIGDELFITAKGSGVAQLQVQLKYNTPASENEACHFDLNVTTIEHVRRFLDPPIFVVPKKPKGSSKRKCRRKGSRKGKRCSRRRRSKCRKRCNRRRNGGRRRRPRPTTPARPLTTRPPQNDGPAPTSISIKICSKFLTVNESAGMSIIDVGVLTGFSVKQDSLVELQDKANPGIAKFEISDRHVYLYLDKIPSTHALCFNLEFKRDFEVGIVQPVPVSVYDYYDPEKICTKFYGPKVDSRLHLRTCEHDSCKCAQDKCSSCKPSDDANVVIRQLCRKYHYSFRGVLRSINEKGKWLHLKFDVRTVYLESATRKITKNTKRLVYTKKTNCDCPRFAGKIDSQFLIMGLNDGLRESKIVMGEDVFVKEWPRKSSDFTRKFASGIKRGCP